MLCFSYLLAMQKLVAHKIEVNHTNCSIDRFGSKCVVCDAFIQCFSMRLR